MDLRAIPAGSGVKYAEIDLEPAVYAVVEGAKFVDDEDELDLSEIFVPILKEVGGLTGNAVSHLRFILADVEAIVKPIAVVPDIGGPPNAYFYTKDRETWRTDFMAFLDKDFDWRGDISSEEDD